MTKKFFAILLALVLAFAMSTVAFASGDVQGSTEDTASATHDPNQNGTPVLIKVYGAEGTTANSPAETFTFTVAAKNSYVIGNPEATYPTEMPSVADAVYGVGDAGSTDNKTKTLAITLPTYSRVGVYEYTITETPSTNAGVETLGTRTLTLVVNVTLKDDGSNETKAYVHAETTGGNKTNSFSDNKYSAGTLTVTKEVTGNMGDTQKEFDVTVEFTAPAGKTVNSTITYDDDTTSYQIAPDDWANGKASVEITLKHNESVKFSNIPYGVTYTVTEDDYTGENGGYDVAAYTYSDDTYKKIDSESDTVKITNNKGTTVDTGVTMDSMPYIVLLALAVVGLAAVTMKKRYEA